MTKPGNGPAVQVLERRSVYIFPTRAGFTLAAMLVVILLGAINYDNALGYLLAFLLGSLVLVAMLHTYRNLVGVGFRGARAVAVFAGEPARFECLIDNPTPRTRLALRLKYWPRGLDRRARRQLKGLESSFNLDPHSNHYVPITIKTRQRGWLPLARIALNTDYPLGILRAWAYFESHEQCLVYPRPRGRLPLPYAPVATAGNATQRTAGVDDFAGLRRYVSGDSVRAIAWRTLARGQELMVKRFQGPSGAEIWLTWAAVAPLADIETRLSQLCAWVLAAERSGMRYGLDIPGSRQPPASGARHRDACLRALALFPPMP
ncbi:MAG: DUF58 domain-containing protein [Gammaproteobacteria bacterium]